MENNTYKNVFKEFYLGDLNICSELEILLEKLILHKTVFFKHDPSNGTSVLVFNQLLKLREYNNNILLHLYETKENTKNLYRIIYIQNPNTGITIDGFEFPKIKKEFITVSRLDIFEAFIKLFKTRIQLEYNSRFEMNVILQYLKFSQLEDSEWEYIKENILKELPNELHRKPNSI